MGTDLKKPAPIGRKKVQAPYLTELYLVCIEKGANLRLVDPNPCAHVEQKG
jgi:hypothetical protein